MGMGKKLTKGLSYAVAPKLTFTAMNPGKAAAMKAASWAMYRMSPAKRRRARVRTAATGFGAAAFALPLGFWMGKKIWSGMSHREMSDTNN
jgi:hypothetical protein